MRGLDTSPKTPRNLPLDPLTPILVGSLRGSQLFKVGTKEQLLGDC